MGDVKQLSIPVTHDQGLCDVEPLRGQATLQVCEELLRRLAACQQAITELDLDSVTVRLDPAHEYVSLSARSDDSGSPNEGISRRPQGAFTAGVVVDRRGEMALTSRTWDFDLGYFKSDSVTELIDLVAEYKREHAMGPRA